MSTIRTVHARDYTVVDNALIKDTSLSLKAKGLALIMLSLPDDWTFTERWLAEQSTDGITALRTAVLELEEKGYLVRKRAKNEKGQFGDNDYTLYEIPVSENPISENPILDNLTLLNTKEPNTKEPSTESKIKHRFGKYHHVLLTDDEMNKLKKAFPNDYIDRIKTLDEGIELKGYKYKSHYLAILKWAKNDRKRTSQSDYDRFMDELQGIYDKAVQDGE